MQQEDKLGVFVGKGLKLMAWVSAAGLLGLMFLTFASVVLRALVEFSAKNLPPQFQVIDYPQGIQDVSELGLLVVVFFGLAYTGWTGGHIAVDLLNNFISRRAQHWVDVFIHLVSAAIIAVLAWQSVEKGLVTIEDGEASHHVSIPFYPFYFVMAFGSLIFALVFCLQAWRAFRDAIDGVDNQ